MVALTKVSSEATPHNENYWFMILLYFASFLVGLGIIAMIAANWQQIPNDIKMLGALAAMFVNAAFLVWTVKTDKKILKQVVSSVYAFLIMGVIGLIGQIFHLPADVENGLLLWSIVSWPLLFAAPRLLWLWIPLFYCGIGCFDLKALWLVIFDDSFYTWFRHPIIDLSTSGVWLDFARNICIVILFAAYELRVIKCPDNDKVVHRPLFFFSGLLMYLLYLLVVKAAYAVIIAPETDTALQVSLSVAYLLPCFIGGIGLLILNRSFKRTTFMPLFLFGTLAQWLWILIMISSDINVPSLSSNGVFNNYPFEAVCPLVFLLITTWYTSCHRVDFRDRLACYIGLLIWFVVTFNENVYHLIPSLILCTVIAWLAYKENSRKWFNIAVLAAVLRILAYYADVSDLQHAGLYLIGSGLFIIAVILLLMKYGRLLWENRDEK